MRRALARLRVLSELLPGVTVLVLVSANDVDLARTAIRHSAKGCIPLNLGFEIAVEAVRFVLAQVLPKRVARSQQVAPEDQPKAA